MLNDIFEGWRQIIRVRHYFKNGKSLCARAKLFMDAPNLKGGKNCPVC